MAVHSSRLFHRFSERKGDVRSLLDVCRRANFNDEHMARLCDKFCNNGSGGTLMDAFVEANRESYEEAELYLLSLAPRPPVVFTEEPPVGFFETARRFFTKLVS